MPNQPALKPKATKKLAKRAMLALLLLVTIGFYAVESMIGTDTPEPGSRSIDSSKQKTLFNHAGKLMALNQTVNHTSKLGQPINVTIEGNRKPAKVGEAFSLKGVVRVNQPIDQAELKWSLPKGVAMTSGSLNTTLHNLAPDTPQVVEVTLTSESEDNRQIHLSVESHSGNIQFSKVAQFNTTQQDVINKSKQRLLERSKDYQDKKKQKVFQ